jgi:hypothetical protein
MTTKMIKWIDEIWDDMLRRRSEWGSEEIYQRADEIYHSKSIFKRRILRNKIYACTIILLDDLSQDFGQYLPIISYMILCIDHRIKTPAKLLKYMRLSNLPFEYFYFKMFVERIFQVQCECINTCQSEV